MISPTPNATRIQQAQCASYKINKHSKKRNLGSKNTMQEPRYPELGYAPSRAHSRHSMNRGHSWPFATDSAGILATQFLSSTAKTQACSNILHFLAALGIFRGGAQRRHDVSTITTGLLYWALRMCSSTSLGVTQMTCCPFQYFTMFRVCSVLMMSFCAILVISLQKQNNSETPSVHFYVLVILHIAKKVIWKFVS